METFDRSGANAVALQLDRWRCLRQEWLVAGDRYAGRMSGHLDMSSLREPIAVDVRTDIVVTWTPARFLWSQWIPFLKEGVDTTRSIPQVSANTMEQCVGCGDASNQTGPMWFRKNYNKVYNWYFKWPHDNDVSESAVMSDNLDAHYGRRGVELPSGVTRLKDGQDVTAADYQVGVSANKLDIRDLAEIQARYKTEQSRDWLAADRYQELMSEIYQVKVGENPEERPWILDHRSDWLRGTNVYATDGSSLGDRAGIMGVDFDHRVNTVAPEHGLLAWFINMRMPPVFYDQYNPFLRRTSYVDVSGDSVLIRAQKPREMGLRSYIATAPNDTGYIEPYGQHYRTGWNAIDYIFKERRSFPIKQINTTDPHKAQKIHPWFASTALQHFYGFLHFDQQVTTDVPGPMTSIFAGD